MKKDTGIYICSGCGIGASIDIEKLEEIGLAGQSVANCKTHNALCSIAGLNLLKEDIGLLKPGKIIIAACSPRAKTEVFDFSENILVERVNLREQLAWCSGPQPEEIQMAAADYLKMAIAKVNAVTVPKPYITESLSTDVMVVGAGITGITAAIEGAKAGYTIHLVEKEANLGGWSRKLLAQAPSKAPYFPFLKPGVEDKITEIKTFSNIKVYTSTQIKQITGQPGAFTVSLQNGTGHEIKVGAVIAAMGWIPYNPTKLAHYGYGQTDKVLTNYEFEERLKHMPESALPQRVLFLQCAGSRGKDHLPYCSNYCCTTSLKQAKIYRDKNPGSLVYFVYKDIRTPGMAEGFYKAVQQDGQILFTKGKVYEVQVSAHNLKVFVKDTLIGEDVAIEVDMLVLATGMVPASTETLNLSYRQGKGLPELKYNFSDSHFICFPYETRRTGLYAAGALRAPMDIASSIEDGQGAMLKAIQCIEATKRGEAVHPRSGDKSCPELYLDRCTDCKRCTEECPFGTYDETPKGTPLPNPARCRRCGICLGSCPERVINFPNYSINSVSAMIKAVEIPDEFEEKPRILVFVCENDAYPALDTAGSKGLIIRPYVRIVPVRCLGSINKVWISDALSCGYDGILQIGCKPGDDYQCHFIHGSKLTETRGENFRETLQTMMLEPERIRVEFVEITEYQKIVDIINNYAEEIVAIGSNPFKGM